MRVGSKVQIIANIPFQYFRGRKKIPPTGTVVAIDGAYINVRPSWKEWVGEWYPNELRVIKY